MIRFVSQQVQRSHAHFYAAKIIFFTETRKKSDKNAFFCRKYLSVEKKIVILQAELVRKLTLSSAQCTKLLTLYRRKQAIATPVNTGHRPKEKEVPNRINDKIRGVQEVRLVGDNVEQGVYTYQQAMRMADEQGLDLVEISASANPVVCKIIDYQKFLYQKKRKEKELKANSAKMVIKEIRFGPQTDEHDYNFKLKHAQEFLKDGNKVKAYVFFRGRSILFKEQGELLLARFANDLADYGKVESVPKLEGKRMLVNIAPKKG